MKAITVITPVTFLSQVHHIITNLLRATTRVRENIGTRKRSYRKAITVTGHVFVTCSCSSSCTISLTQEKKDTKQEEKESNQIHHSQHVCYMLLQPRRGNKNMLFPILTGEFTRG